MRRISIAFLLALTACATDHPPEPQIVVREVRIAVPIPCRPDPASIAPRTYPDTHEALQHAADIDRLVRLLGAGRLIRDEEIAALRAALLVCGG